MFCDGCGKEFEEDELIFVEDAEEYYCEECVDEKCVYCDECGELTANYITTVSDLHYCSDCADNYKSPDEYEDDEYDFAVEIVNFNIITWSISHREKVLKALIESSGLAEETFIALFDEESEEYDKYTDEDGLIPESNFAPDEIQSILDFDIVEGKVVFAETQPFCNSMGSQAVELLDDLGIETEENGTCQAHGFDVTGVVYIEREKPQ